MTDNTTRRFSFGPFILIPEQQQLLDGCTPVRIGTRALDILAALVERPGELVSKSELFARVWPDTFVDDTNLKVNVAGLRRALGDGVGGARYIATVTGKGYRFVAPVRALAPARLGNLPAAATRLVGRGAAIEAILGHVAAARLVTLVGAGGIGKTSVALVVAERLAAGAEHGVWFVDLAPVGDPALVPGAIAGVLGLPVHAADIGPALAAFLRDRSLTLVLDNCEHLIEAAAGCAAWLLAEAPGLRVLATSREPLRVAGEQVYRLPPLDCPPAEAELSAAAALAFPAVALFAERAAASVPGFALDGAEAAVVAEICRRLDGLALAIELAAARVDAFGLRDILCLLDDRLRLLQGPRTAPARQQTLAATLDWSHGLLAEPECRILRRLAAFAGPFGLESACAVAADGDLDRGAVIAGLGNLVAKSLVAVEGGQGLAQYRLLDTTRGYAQGKLGASGEGDAVWRRHARHMRDLAERAEAAWQVRPTADWLAHYGRKVDDIRAALGWAFAAAGDVAVGVALTVAAIPFWEHLSLVEECRAGVERALSTAGAGLAPRDEMKLQTALGTTLLHTLGPLPRVRAAWAQGLALAERLGDAEYRLRCLWGLCDYHSWTGDHRTALDIVHRIRALAIEAGDEAAVVNVDRQAGTALRYLGQLAEARGRLEGMIARYVPPVVRADIARFQLDPRLAARGTLANVLWLQGLPDQAAAAARAHLAEARAAGHAMALCNALVHAACPVALFVGDLAAAEGLLAEIEGHVAAHAMAVWSAMGRCLRGEWLLARGEPAGLAVLRGGLDALAAVGFRMRCPAHLGTLGQGLAVHGDAAAGLAAVEQAIALAEAGGEVWCLPELMRIKAAISGPSAAGLYGQALDLARRQGALALELRVAIGLAESGLGAGPLAEAYGRFTEGFATRDLVRARGLLDAIR